MTEETRAGEAPRLYAAAHRAHYELEDLRQALELYSGVIDSHPRSQEASYCRTQIRNIVEGVVPEAALLEAHLALASSHLGLDEARDGAIESSSLRRSRSEADSAWEEEQRGRRDAETLRRAEARRKGAW